MDGRYDFIAIGPHGVYGLCEDIPGDPGGVAKEFIAKIEARGHRIERVTVAEAVERHKAYLGRAALADDGRGTDA